MHRILMNRRMVITLKPGAFVFFDIAFSGQTASLPRNVTMPFRDGVDGESRDKRALQGKCRGTQGVRSS